MQSKLSVGFIASSCLSTAMNCVKKPPKEAHSFEAYGDVTTVLHNHNICMLYPAIQVPCMSIRCTVQEILSHKFSNAYRTMNMVYFKVSLVQMIGGGKSVALCGLVLLFFCSFVPCLVMHNCASE